MIFPSLIINIIAIIWCIDNDKFYKKKIKLDQKAEEELKQVQPSKYDLLQKLKKYELWFRILICTFQV